MEYARHDARMRQPADKEGKVSTRRALEATAARGVVSAIKLLEGPPFPDSLEYLWDHFQQLDRMRPEGMAGLAALTPPVILAARELFDWQLEPHEVEAIAALDLVTRFPDAGEQ